MEEQRERLVERHVLKLSVDARTHVVILGRNASSHVRGNVGKNEESQHEQRTDNGHHSEEKLRIREKGRSNVGLVLEELHNETSNESSGATRELEDRVEHTVEGGRRLRKALRART